MIITYVSFSSFFRDSNLAKYTDDAIYDAFMTAKRIWSMLKLNFKKALIILGWFENNYFRANSGKCNTLLTLDIIF